MKESTRMAELFADLYGGEPWIDVTITDTLKGITFEHANRKAGNCNSIWQIVEHMISWRNNVIRRVSGEIKPANDQNYITRITDASEEAWNKTLQRLTHSQEEWIAFLNQFKDEDLEKVYEPSGMNYYKNIHGIIQHDAYHLGQIVVLAKLTAGKLTSVT